MFTFLSNLIRSDYNNIFLNWNRSKTDASRINQLSPPPPQLSFNYPRRSSANSLLSISAVSPPIVHRSSIEITNRRSHHPRQVVWHRDDDLAGGNCFWRDCTTSFLDWSCTCRMHRCRGAAGSSRRWAAAVPPAAVVRFCSAASTCRCRRRCSRRRSPRRYRRARASQSRPTILFITHPAAWPCRWGPRRDRRWWCRVHRQARCRRWDPRLCRRLIRIPRISLTRPLTRTFCWRCSRGTRIWKVSERAGMRLENSTSREDSFFHRSELIRLDLRTEYAF